MPLVAVHGEGRAGPAVPVALEPRAAVAARGVAAGVGGGVEVAKNEKREKVFFFGRERGWVGE